MCPRALPGARGHMCANGVNRDGVVGVQSG
jgi:hypothetical protein